ncbi:uncharacterized protein [Elaeis guineensis]|uniref:Uncharacterized protein LOC105058458 n=1 Tax=Elaeis guineensis var. tenera TaxID=51953 RepID=A0A8N4FAQ2_ELAGV|nr:uncharacterized protein LOC105058458 [Elaeis guineensis]
MDEKPASRPPTKKKLFDWQVGHYNKEMLMGFDLSNRTSGATDLLQNCDLPPPLKLFSPIEDDEKKNKITAINSTPLVPQNSLPTPAPSENSSLLRALRLSQTRAREAEKKASLANARNEHMATLLLEESLRLSAHRQWVKLLEAEVAMLQEKILWSRTEEHAEGDAMPAAATWCLALALCLGIGGVGIALGRHLF